MITQIVPTILTDTAENFHQYIDAYKSFANRLQLDISDGEFAPVKTVDLESIILPDDWTGQWDFHMMVKNPSKFLPVILKLKPSLCIFHAEASENLLPIFEELSKAGIKTGVALLQSTYPGAVRSYIEAADHVLIFSGRLAQQGGQADMLQLEKVPIIKSIDQNVEIGWDGGANIENVRAIARSEVNIINVGSALANSSDPAQTYQNLTTETDKQGVRI